jgi:hypothetical protein
MIKSKSKKLKGKGIYDKTVNYFTGSNLKDGEMHAVIYDPKAKKYTTANYTGPGTKLLERLKAGDQPKVKSDKVSQAHDIRYTLSKDIEGIKNADSKMVNKLKELQKNKEDSNFNIIPAKLGIQANQVLAKVLPTKYFDKFVNYMTDYKSANDKLSSEDKKLLESKLSELENEGFGKKRVRKPKKNKNKSLREFY